MGLLLDTKKLIEDLQYNLEVIKQFKCNTKNFYNFTSKFSDYIKQELFDKNEDESSKVSKRVDILFKWFII